MNRTHILTSVIGALVLGLSGAGAVAHAASSGGLDARTNSDGAQLILVRSSGGFGGGHGISAGVGFGGGGYAYGNRYYPVKGQSPYRPPCGSYPNPQC